MSLISWIVDPPDEPYGELISFTGPEKFSFKLKASFIALTTCIAPIFFLSGGASTKEWIVTILVFTVLPLSFLVYAWNKTYAKAARFVEIEGDTFRVTARGKRVFFSISDIESIRSYINTMPETVVIKLKTPCELGDSITFIPLYRRRKIARHPIVKKISRMMSELSTPPQQST